MCKLRGLCEIIILIYLLIKDQGSAERPVVTFSPDYNKIFTGEKMTMTCNVESAALRYSWYCDNIPVYTGQKYTILSADIRHGGDYHCQTNAGDRSETVTLNVTDGPVILQAPLYVYEGDDVSLRCHSPQGRSARQTIFYRNNQIIQTSATNPDLLPIKYTELTDTYRCAKLLLTTITDTHSARTTISYTANAETISVKFVPDWNKLLTGENVIMICYGKSGLNYYWYKDGNKVADRKIYTIRSAQVGHRGTYQCRTSNGISAEFRLEVSDGPVILQAPVFLNRGSDLVLRCHSRPGYSVISTAFFKHDVRQPFLSNSDLITISSNEIQAGRYRCEKKLSQDEYVTYTDDVTLHIKGQQKADYTTVTIIRLALSGCVLVLTCCFLVYHIKTEVIPSSK
ncbi:sialoadhesin-like isoform X2 [Pyxicephalus adspersus]|uniref:sialoadhesin-like isoform X2 n=1 Tax=Pyxicephalus adspersus TaxID=30357 RepID=UPI003B598C84